MAVFLGVIVVISLFVAAIALCTALVGFGAWLRWRIALLPHMRQSSDLRTWYKREKVKDDDRRNMQRMAFGMVFLIVQVPFSFLRATHMAIPNGAARPWCLLSTPGVYGHWLGGRARLERHVTEKHRQHTMHLIY